MANINELEQPPVIKGIIMADPGAGKTCALAALVNAGWDLRVLDFDNKMASILPFLTPESRASDRLHYITLTDKLKTTVDGKILCDGSPKAISRAMSILNNWKIGEENLGKTSEWNEDCILVMDTLTFMGNAAMRYVKVLAGRDGQRPHPADWGNAQDIQRGLLELLFSDAIKCNILVLSHIVYMGGRSSEPDNEGKYKKISDNIEPNSALTAYPSGLGRVMPPEVGRYFDSMLNIRMVGSRRVLRTSSEPYMTLRNPKPATVPKEISLKLTQEGYADPEGGLAKYFRLILGREPRQSQAMAEGRTERYNS